jgi:hypothetical protein
MTFMLPQTPPPVMRARGADKPLPTTWQGLGAAFTSAQITGGVGSPIQTETNRLRAERAVDLAARVGLENIIAWEQANGDGYDHIRLPPETIEEALGQNGPHFADMVYGAAQEAAKADPATWDGIDVTGDVTAEALANVQKEYQNAQDMLDLLSPASRPFIEAGGSMAGLTADPVNIGMMAIPGGQGGSFLRVVGREAFLNMAAEAVTMPRQFDMAAQLNIPDPDIVQQLTFAAAAGGILGGLVEAGARGLTYYRGTRAPVPGAARNPVSQSLLVDTAEVAITDSPNPFPRTMAAMEADPIAPPLPPLIPADAPRPPLVLGYMDRVEPSAPLDLPPAPQSAIEGLQSEIDTLRGQDRQVNPLIQRLRTNHVVTKAMRKRDPNVTGGEDLRISPTGTVGQALKQADITPKRYPGLFSTKTGRTDFDTLVASEWEESFPGITDATGSRNRSDGYLDPNGFIDVLIRSANGDNSWMRQRADLAALERQLAGAERLADEGPTTTVDDFLTKRQAPRGFFVDLEAYAFDPGPKGIAGDIAADLDTWLRERGISLYPFERTEMIDQLARDGGDAEFLLERALERNMDFVEAADGPSQATSRNAPEPGGNGLAEARPFAGQEASGAAGGGNDAPPAGTIERTAAGDQFLAPGIEPVTQRERLEARQREALVGKARPMSEGLFDLGAREQMDWLDQPAGKKAEPVQRQREADLRDAVAQGDNPNVVLPNGREGTLADLLDDLDQGDMVSARLDLCGKGPM